MSIEAIFSALCRRGVLPREWNAGDGTDHAAFLLRRAEELVAALKELADSDRASFLDVRIHKGLSGKLPPLDFDHREAIDALMTELKQ